MLNAYVSGALGGIEELEGELARLGLPVPLLLVHSGGRLDHGRRGAPPAARPRARRAPRPASPPSVEVGAATGVDHLITCDMGGTSFDVSVVVDGSPPAGCAATSWGCGPRCRSSTSSRSAPGGGSIGWIDARDVLRVGPRSAGAVPGPACYGRGGTEATVTDALLVLGFLDPTRFLGGDVPRSTPMPRATRARALGEPLGLDADDTAWGIRELALAGMVEGHARRASPRSASTRATTRCSASAAAARCSRPRSRDAIGAPRVIVPELASVLSAFGAATADVRRERAAVGARDRARSIPTVVEKIAEELARTVDADLDADGVAPADRSVEFEADLRFAKQSVRAHDPRAGGAPLAHGARAARRRLPRRVRERLRPRARSCSARRSSW